MGFHSVTTGYVISESDGVEAFLNVVCKSITIDGKKYTKENFSETELYEFELTDIREHEISFELYDDIEMDRGMFYYKKDHNIKIGTPQCCACMIYLFCVGDDMGGGDNTYVPDTSILNLIEWKRQLVKEGRVDSDVKFGGVMNCCS